METLTREMNSKYASIILPNTVIKGVGIITGFSGNILVFLLYTFWIQNNGDSHYFIPFLAFVDALGSLMQGTFYLLADEYAFIFPNDIVCRSLYFVFTTLSGISAHCLLAIALQRYILICEPFGRQLSLTTKRLAIVFISLASCVYAFPLIFYSGVKEEEISFRGQNFTALICRMVMEVSSSSTIYVTFLLLLTLANVIVTSFLYVPVSKIVYRAMKLMKKRAQTKNSFRNREQQAAANQETLLHNDDHMSGVNNMSKNEMPSEKNGGFASIRISLMFLIVIVVYIISYIPSFIVVLINHYYKDFDPLQLTDAGLNTWRFFNTTCFFNHVCNPFIYWYYDKKLRKAFARLCGKKT